jgi:hypothetical protein
MKKITIFFVLLLLLGLSPVYAQVAKAVENGKPESAALLADPKLTPEQQAQIMVAGEDNPARIDEAAMDDPKLTTDEQALRKAAGEDNPARIDEASQVDPKLNTKEPDAAVGSDELTAPADNQPAGDNSGAAIDYRSMTSSGNDQPQGEIPAHNLNYRDMQGSGQQPSGDTPNK